MAKRNEEVAVEDARKHPFFIVDNDVIAVHGPQLGVYGVAVYNVLAYYANNKTDGAWPSYQTIADHLGISRPKVIQTIKLLIDLGLVTKTARTTATGDSTSNRYVLADIHAGGGKPHLPPSKQDLPPSKPHLPPSKQDLPPPSKPRLPPSKQDLPEQELINKNYSFEQEPVSERAAPPAADAALRDGKVKRARISSPHLDPRRFVNGFVPPGTGRSAVEVYYERFSINAEDHRLSEPLEDDLIRNCPDLELLREVIGVYHQRNHRPRNINLILDWYRDPSRFRRDHASHNGHHPRSYERPPDAQFTQEEFNAYQDPDRDEIPY